MPLFLEVLMRAPLTHGAATAWLVAFVATLAPATALAQAVDPAASSGNGAQQQPADPPPGPCAVPGTPGCAPADTTAPGPGPVAQPPVDTGTVPLGPTGPVVDVGVKPPVVEIAPAAVQTMPVQSLAPSQPDRHDGPPRADAPPGPSKPYGQDEKPKPKHDQPPKKPDGSGTSSPSGDTSGGDDHAGNGNGNGNANGNGDDQQRDQFVVDGQTIRLGGCRTFSAATAKVTFERIRFGKDRFTVTVRHLDLPAGTVLTVRVDGRIAGTLTIDDTGHGKLTRRGDHLPRFLRLEGDERVTIGNDAGDILLSRACLQKGGDDGGD